jgi:hypothetical protein
MRRFATIALLFTAIVLLSTQPAHAWGAEGHRIIGQIAWTYLTPDAKARITELLGEQSLGEAGCWADQIRSDRAYDWAKPLHFVNVPRDAEAVDTARDCPDGECVVAAIRKYEAIVRDATAAKEDRIEALRFLIHFVGDVHQPLHVSYAEDRGGNRRSLTFMGKRSNFHKVWDTDLIEQRVTGDDWMKLGAELQASITPEEAEQYAASADPLAWANESLQITRRLYRELESDELGEPYYTANIGTVETQLQKAGVRLAGVLNASFEMTDHPNENETEDQGTGTAKP